MHDPLRTRRFSMPCSPEFLRQLNELQDDEQRRGFKRPSQADVMHELVEQEYEKHLLETGEVGAFSTD